MNITKYALLLAVTICAVVSCKETSLQKNVEVRIISPYKCDYKLYIAGDSLLVQSKSIQVTKIDSLNLKFDTLVRKYDTLLTELDREKVASLLNTVPNKVSVDSLNARDTYSFELLLDGKLVRKKNGHDEDVYSIIRMLRPYIKEKRIMCCDFFQMFDSTK